MAYLSQRTKNKVVENIKKVLPNGWKASYRVENKTTLILNIYEANVDLINENKKSSLEVNGCINITNFELENIYDGRILEVMNDIKKALNSENYNKSDPIQDIYDSNYFVEIRIGTYEKPFTHKVNNKTNNLTSNEILKNIKRKMR